MAATSTGSGTLVGILAIALGLWSGCGGCLQAVGSLGGNAEPADNPFLNAAQNAAIQDLIVATGAYDPINAATSALSALLGPFLVVAGVMLIARMPSAGLVGRVAFGASMLIDVIHAIWSVIWFVLVWEPLVAYAGSILKSLPDKPPGMEDALPWIVVMQVVLALGYFLVKVGLAAAGFAAAGRVDRAEADGEAEEGEPDPDAAWALEEPEERLPTEDAPTES